MDSEEVLLLTATDVAQLLGVTKRTIMAYKARRILPYYQLGRVLRFKMSDVLAHIEENMIVSPIKKEGSWHS